MSKKIVKFIVVGDGEGQYFKLTPDNFFYRKGDWNNPVITGTLEEGTVVTGACVILKSLINGKDQTIKSVISRIEIQKEKVEEAVAGSQIGIRLTNVGTGALRRIRRSNKMRL